MPKIQKVQIAVVGVAVLVAVVKDVAELAADHVL